MVHLLRKIVKVGGEIVDKEKLMKWFEKQLDKLPNGEYLNTIEPTDRTKAQNAFYWVVVTEMAKGFGNTYPNDIHEYLKSQFLPSREYFVLIRKKQVDSTTKLNVDEMIRYIDNVIQFAAEQGIVIEDVEDYKHNLLN